MLVLSSVRLRVAAYRVRCYASDFTLRAIGTVVGLHPNRHHLLVTFYWQCANTGIDIWAERAIVDPAELETIL